MVERMTSAQYPTNQMFLVETDWLERHLSDANLRVFDCTTYLDPDPVNTYSVRSGRKNWQNGHIPGADFVELQGELSDTASPFRFTMPSSEQFAAAMSRHGVGEDTHVVLYCSDRAGWATRVWWMLRAFGFDNASVLNGGLDKWVAEGRPLSQAPANYPPASFVARPRPELIANKTEVLAALSDRKSRVINALTAPQFTGEGGVHYGRPGRIAGSANVVSRDLIDDVSKAFLPRERLVALFAPAEVESADRIITYCGGGIAASIDAFALTMLGYRNVALYDGSLSEWATDPSAPMEVGPLSRP
jgi:thiosulfate/3-mercaptopyruvate sulfurtransferase